MPTYIVHYIFRAGAAGWTENFYLEATNRDTAEAEVTVLGWLRSVMVGAGAGLVAARFSDIAIDGDANLTTFSLGGGASGGGGFRDQYTTAIVCRAEAEKGLYRRTVTLRGCPDAYAVYDPIKGEMVPGDSFKGNFDPFVGRLAGAGFGWKIRGWSKAAEDVAKMPIESVSTLVAGTIIYTAPGHVFAKGDRVRVRGVKGLGAEGCNRTDKVIDAAPGQSFSLPLLPGESPPVPGEKNTGTARRQVKKLFQIDDCIYNKIGSRKTGRPFDSPRGRQRARR